MEIARMNHIQRHFTIVKFDEGVTCSVATSLWPSVGVKPNTPKVGDLGSFGTFDV